MKKSATGEKTSLLKWAEERMKLKRELEEEKRKQQTSKEPRDSSPVAVPYLPDDCIFHIIVRLPLESLLSSRFVCKAWYRIVNRPDFVDSHLKRSSVGLIYLTPAARAASSSNGGSSSAVKKDEFNADAKVLGLDSVAVLHWHLFSPRTRFQIKYLEIGGAKSTIKEYNVTCTGHIKATCNGLIVLEKVVKGRGLIVMNPVTREVETVPLGTMCDPHRESYGLAFCRELSRYKLVHLFQDASQCIGCEIIHIGSRTWRVVEGPPHGFMGWLGYAPVSAIGALHWVPNVDHNEHIVSMPLKDEEFVKIPLPSTGGIHDRVLEIDGSLGFVSRESAIRICVWILKSLGGEGWAKQHNVVLNRARDMVPRYCVGTGGELVFEHGEHLYAYDRGSRVMRKIKAKNEWRPSPGCYFPHVNSLVSWKI